MKPTVLTCLAALALAAPLGMTAAADLARDAPLGADVTPSPFQALEPCLLGHLPGETLYEEGFEGGDMAGWSKVGFTYSNGTQRPNLWHWTTFAGNNSAMDALGHGGPGRLYYGIENELGGTFNTDPYENRGDVRSPVLSVPSEGQAAVNLHTKWHVEWDRPTRYDGMMFGYVDEATGQRVLLCFFGMWYGERVQPGIGYYANSPSGNWLLTGCKQYPRHYPLCQPSVEEALGTNPLVFDLAPYTNLWEPRSILLPQELAGRQVRLVLYFLEGDALINDATGWMVDDVQLVRVAGH